ncbi:hypothetical protein [Phycobacter sp. K97]|uniref:hypothetical protein n=1 Tax=Phycobacter sedimenti TaxID=3133977 RepID=UPI003120351C
MADRFPNVREVHKDFGSGLDRAVADGGFDQIAARNHAQRLVEEAKPDWIIRNDADEILLNAALDAVAQTGDRYDLITFDYHTLLAGGRHWDAPHLNRRVAQETLLDPHLATWRRELELYDEACPQTVLTSVNTTRHCNIRASHIPSFRMKTVKGLMHLHLHCLLGKANACLRDQGTLLEQDLPEEARLCLRGLGLEGAWDGRFENRQQLEDIT